jgi:hypothetical protein
VKHRKEIIKELGEMEERWGEKGYRYGGKK